MLLLAIMLLPTSLATDTLVENDMRDRYGGALLFVDSQLVVGEPAGFSDPGMVHVLEDNGRQSWNIVQTLTAPDAAVGDEFGSAFAYSGGWLAVTAPAAGDGSGAVHLFRKGSDGTWAHAGTVDGTPGDRISGFAGSLAMGGGYLFISAPSAAGRNGEVHVHRLEDGFAHVKTLSGTDQFGTGLAVWKTHLLVGSPGHDSNRGNIQQFDIQNGFSRAGTFTLPDAAEGTRLGGALVVHGDRLFASNPRADRGTGAVHVFDLSARDLKLAGVLAPSGSSEGPRMFGASVAVSGDEVLVAAPLDGASGVIHRFAGPALRPLGAVPSDAPSGRSQFGAALAANDTFMASGMPGDDYGLGAIALYERDDASWSKVGVYSRPVPSMERLASGMVECEDGEANGHACQNVDLVSFIPLSDMRMNRGVRLNDVWGWTDPESGKEIGIIGHMEGTVFVNVTDPQRPIVLGEMTRTPGSPGSTHRDMKVYKDHVFVVADGSGDHGMQVFDLRRLLDWSGEYEYYEPDVLYTEIASSHNIVINENTGYAYTVGNSSGGTTCGGGLHMINVQDPRNPTFMGCFNDSKTGSNGSGATHDAQCVTYNGPDSEHRGKEICIGSNGTAISVADVSDKDNPIAISQGTYPNSAYVHQGWFTDDHRYFYQNDEADELNGLTDRTRTMIWDLTDLDEPEMIAEYFGDSNSTDHNLYIDGDFMYQTNNASGLRVIDIRDRTNPVEFGFFDTTPRNRNVAGFDGTWSSYPYFKSGNILVTSRREGVFVLRSRQVDL
jgi:choice-of-anchor B domain-containing protein